MSPSTGRPSHQQRGPEGEQPHQRLPRVCATGRSEAEDGGGEHELLRSRSPGAKRRACCATRSRRENRPGPGGPTRGDE
jgi:hypothetical protein